ncbi:magnesium and cobalt transport protein CorA [Georgenia sp. TF02-10]|uniref:magnesium and cobalt transport protein CorA n=1 Tax=Georgenia sp. TF02-10 TaxID=2917725 RepID=UPI001FA77CA0|nr:magnesium and cobalt transport protein CorA [Georgenia sp. TF02-10]UNX54556.1 magnesium and cobalt transport protein CorA [Georgenia sp. TF02-10]
MTVVDNAVYVDGRRHAEPGSLDLAFDVMDEVHGMAWIDLYRPDRSELDAVAREFGIHYLAVDDAIAAHQRPKVERYGDVLFTVLRAVRYLEAEERLELGELHVFTGADFVVTIRHAECPDLGRVRRRMEDQPELLRLGPEAVLYAILDEVVDEYAPVVAGLQNDIDEIEDEVFGGDPAVSRRIYALFREVIGFQRSIDPLGDVLQALPGGDAVPAGTTSRHPGHTELKRHLRDVADHVTRVSERADGFHALLQNILTVNATLVGQRQNEETKRLTETSVAQGEQMKRISAWAAILFAPTLVSSVYGMNFDVMPELHWTLGYPWAVALMVAACLVAYVIFKRKDWL